MGEQAHTPGPWHVGNRATVRNRTGVIAECARIFYGGGKGSDARRDEANAVGGISTEALEAGVIRELLEVLDDIVPRLEWDGWDDMYRTHICPVCGAYRNKYKHYPNCKMAKAVRLLQQIRGDADA